MMKLLALTFPVLPGKTEQFKKFMNELKTTRKTEFNESRKSLGVYERTFLQATPMGDMVIVTLEGEDPQGAFEKFGQKNDEFTKWFSAQVKEINGVDLTQKQTNAFPELVTESEMIEEHAHH